MKLINNDEIKITNNDETKITNSKIKQHVMVRTLLSSKKKISKKKKMKQTKNKKKQKKKRKKRRVNNNDDNNNNNNNNTTTTNNNGIVFDESKNILVCLGKSQKSHSNLNNSNFLDSKPILFTTLYFYKQGLKCFICSNIRRKNINNSCSNHNFVSINFNAKGDHHFDKYDFVQCEKCKYLKILIEKKNNLQTNDQCAQCLEHINECCCEICNSCENVKECFKCEVCSECDFCKGCQNCLKRKKKICVCDDE